LFFVKNLHILTVEEQCLVDGVTQPAALKVHFQLIGGAENHNLKNLVIYFKGADNLIAYINGAVNMRWKLLRLGVSHFVLLRRWVS
jgi:hypothetical protein